MRNSSKWKKVLESVKEYLTYEHLALTEVKVVQERIRKKVNGSTASTHIHFAKSISTSTTTDGRWHKLNKSTINKREYFPIERGMCNREWLILHIAPERHTPRSNKLASNWW
jgi:hypothetical protein